jgi:hypothetical protein
VSKGPKERIVSGAIQFDLSKLDDILNDHLISEELDRVSSFLEEHRRRGRSHDENWSRRFTDENALEERSAKCCEQRFV